MNKNTHEQGPEYPQGSIVNLAKEQHPGNKPIEDSEVVDTWWCSDRQCWMHDVTFAGKPNSWPHGCLKLIRK